PKAPVSYWHADGDYGDAAGPNDGTPGGGVSFAAGKVGQAFSFDGTTGFVLLPHIGMSGPSITVAVWVRATALGRGQQWLIGEDFATQLNVSPGDAPQLQYADSSGFSILRDPDDFPLDGWVHVIGTIAPAPGQGGGTRIKLYRQGRLA